MNIKQPLIIMISNNIKFRDINLQKLFFQTRHSTWNTQQEIDLLNQIERNEILTIKPIYQLK